MRWDLFAHDLIHPLALGQGEVRGESDTAFCVILILKMTFCVILPADTKYARDLQLLINSAVVTVKDYTCMHHHHVFVKAE